MAIGGDTMANYYVVGPVEIEVLRGGLVKCWVLGRKRITHTGQYMPAYFACDTFRRMHPKNYASLYATNREGLSFIDWVAALGGVRLQVNAAHMAWQRGEDPTDYRAAK
jgi:hypothetical protein